MNQCYFCGKPLDRAEYDGKPRWHEACKQKLIATTIAAQPSANPSLADYWTKPQATSNKNYEMRQAMNADDFDYIYNSDGTCTLWDCGQPAVVLAYDDFAPEIGHWFCERHWPNFEEICIVVEDKRGTP